MWKWSKGIARWFRAGISELRPGLDEYISE